jgi:hypothetical protein
LDEVGGENLGDEQDFIVFAQVIILQVRYQLEEEMKKEVIKLGWMEAEWKVCRREVKGK